MTTSLSGSIRRSKRKLSIQSDLSNSYAFSQNPISTPKKQKLSSFSQSQPTQLLQEIPIYSESPIFGDSEYPVEAQKSQVFVEIPKKWSQLFEHSTIRSSTSTRTPYGLKTTI